MSDEMENEWTLSQPNDAEMRVQAWAQRIVESTKDHEGDHEDPVTLAREIELLRARAEPTPSQRTKELFLRAELSALRAAQPLTCKHEQNDAAPAPSGGELEWRAHPKYEDCWLADSPSNNGYPEWGIDITGTRWEADKPVENVQYVVKHGSHGLAYRDTLAAAKSLANSLQRILEGEGPK